MSSELNVVGKKVERVDAFERLVGEAKYAADIYLPDMLTVKILRSPYPHAKVMRIDAAKAQALPGVKAILTAADMPDYPIHRRETPPTVVMPVLATTARYAGDEILAVAAVDEETAEEALELIKIDYQILPFVLDVEEAVQPTAPKLYPEGNAIQEKADITIRGNIDEGFRAGGGDPRREVQNPHDPAYHPGAPRHGGEVERKETHPMGFPQSPF